MGTYRAHAVWGQFANIQVSGVEEVKTDSEVVREQWYSMDGRVLTEPESGTLCIRIATHTDGTKTKSKVMVSAD